MTTSNNTTYRSTEITVLGNRFVIVIASGKINYVQISKVTNNPYLTAGKLFTDMDAAVSHYKTPEMKLELLKIETGLTVLN